MATGSKKVTKKTPPAKKSTAKAASAAAAKPAPAKKAAEKPKPIKAKETAELLRNVTPTCLTRKKRKSPQRLPREEPFSSLEKPEPAIVSLRM
ncbi:hypothetical protein R3P38DRAFT_3292610 [Favolaschia claudopus]|uniref:Uncharacterized protein n=1 Tax=Favolaschia claudopus TaxID=2862362 RepID=A0AAV9ZIG3_9AGAR